MNKQSGKKCRWLRNWKTTLAGIGMIAAAVAKIADQAALGGRATGIIQAVTEPETIGLITGGIGLIRAADDTSAPEPEPDPEPVDMEDFF